MNRGFNAATELMRQVLDDLKPFAEVLSLQDRMIYAEFTENELSGRVSSVNAGSLLSLEAALIVILLEEQKRTQRLYNELCAEIRRLKMIAGRLQETISLEEAGRRTGQ